jgi:hypothetical protein
LNSGTRDTYHSLVSSLFIYIKRWKRRQTLTFAINTRHNKKIYFSGARKKLLWRNHLIVIMMLSGALPPPLWHPPIAIVPYYVYAIVEKFPVQVMSRHRNAPPPPMGGQGWRKGGDHHGKRGFLQSKFFLKKSPVMVYFHQDSSTCKKSSDLKLEKNPSGFFDRGSRMADPPRGIIIFSGHPCQIPVGRAL